MGGPKERRRLLLLFGVSLLVRLIAVGAMTLADARPAFDEFHYLERAEAWASVTGLNDAVPDSLAWSRAYADGFQPPLHPLLTGLATTGRHLPGAARLWNALLTALATPLVYLLARRLVDRRSAFAAAWLHVVYPTLSFFAASLWAEPLYILLMLGAVERTLAAREAPTPESRLRRALAAGLCLGLLLLTRTAALPWLLVLPSVLLGRPRAWNARWKEAAGMLLVAAVVITPWQIALHRNEDRPALLATSSGWNLALGNNPYVGPGEGSVWVGPKVHAVLEREVGDDAAAYALDQVRSDPGAAVGRALDRLRLLWTADLFPVRHIAHGITRPGPWWAGMSVWTTTTLTYLALLAFAIVGMLQGGFHHKRAVVLWLVAAGCLGPLASVSFPRLHLPLLVLLLPAAGYGWTRRHVMLPGKMRLLGALLITALVWLSTSSLGPLMRSQMLPSASSSSWVGTVADIACVEVVFADQVEIAYATPDDRRVGALEISGAHEVAAVLSPDGPAAVTVTLIGDGGNDDRMLSVRRAVDGVEVQVDPITSEFWRARVSLAGRGLPGVTLRWLGGGVAADGKDLR